ncbi:MAG: hypothetical protein WCS01_13255, partial [bacterium]
MLKIGWMFLYGFVCMTCCIARIYADGAGERGETGQKVVDDGRVPGVVTQTWKDAYYLIVNPRDYFKDADAPYCYWYLSGMPVQLELRLHSSKSGVASGSQSVKPLVPEKWYETADCHMREVAGTEVSVLKPVLRREGRVWDDDPRRSEWVIPGEATANLRGQYRVVAKWQGIVNKWGGATAEGYIYFREATNDQERACVYLARACDDLASGDYESMLTNVEAAARSAGGYAYYREYPIWDSAYMLAHARYGVGRYAEAATAYEEYMRRSGHKSSSNWDADDMDFIKDAKSREAAAKTQPSTLPINRAAKWDGKKAGDVETLDIGDGVLLRMVWCPPGSYIRGSPEG